MEQSEKKIGLINWIVLLVTSAAMLVMSRWVNSAAGVVATIICGVGLLVSLVSYFQMRLVEREGLERLEMEELAKSRGDTSLFAASADETFPAKRSREIFERYFVPGFTIVLFLFLSAGAYFSWTLVGTMPPLVASQATLAMALMGLLGIVLFLLGKYSVNLARLQKQRLLRAGAGYLLLTAYVCFVVIATMGAVLAGFPKTDFIVARALAVVLGLIAVEALVSLISELYRVRVKGREARLLYDSRLVGLLGQPEGIIATIGHALDYQFGFKVSDTWFYQLLRERFALLVLAQVVILILSSCVVFIDPGEQALLERFGAPVADRGVIGPGLHFTLPWPIDQVHRYPTDKIQSFVVGEEEGSEQEKVQAQSRTIVWSVAHGKEDNLLVATRDRSTEPQTGDTKKSPPVNLISVGIPVQFQITNLSQWAYINEDPDSLLQGLANREVVHYLASADLDEVMARGRGEAAKVLQERIQAAADGRELGARIVYVGVEDIHPSVKAAADYEKLIGAMQQREAKILDARAYATRTNAQARAEAFKRVGAAEAEKEALTSGRQGREALFAGQLAALNAAPDVYTNRAYLQTIAKNTKDARKYVMANTNTTQILQLDLTDKVRRDLENSLDIAPTKK
jgi:regulator of protease activity HflC (stomatin/prohibitin superfamily)